MIHKAAVVGLAVIVLLTACNEGAEQEASDQPYFPTAPRQESYPAALIDGTLHERDGCLIISVSASGSGLELWLPIWPEGFAYHSDDSAVVDDAGGVFRELDTEVTVGGGELDRGASAIPQAIPGRCDTDHYWLVSPD